jgi:hypothetical protein
MAGKNNSDRNMIIQELNLYLQTKINEYITNNNNNNNNNVF